MPIYEYLCVNCGAAFEKLVRSARNQQKVVCPACGSEQVHRRISMIATPRAADRRVPGRGSCEGCDRSDGACPLRPR